MYFLYLKNNDIIKIANEYIEFIKDNYDFLKSYRRKDLLDNINKKTIILLMNEDNDIIGTGTIIESYIKNVVIKKNYRNKGLCKILISNIIDYIKQNNISSIIKLDVVKTNYPAIKCYTSLNFKFYKEYNYKVDIYKLSLK